MNQQQLAQVYQMVDNVPFSRQKKNIARDFSDALMMAELIYHYYPKRVQLHNYPSTNTVNKKIQNWNTLNNKVLKKMGLLLTANQIQEIANARAMTVQKLLYRFLLKFQRPQQQMKISNRFQNNEQNQQSFQNNPRNSRGIISVANKKGQLVNIKKQHQDSEQVLDLIDKIDYAYAQLTKLQQMSRLKDDVIKNLQKKVQIIIFN